MIFAVDAWAPEYGAPLEAAAFEEAAVEVDESAEVAIDRWAPVDVAGVDPYGHVLFVDGVRRVEATVWITEGDEVHQGLCASYAAGVMCCDGTAHLVEAQVRRVLLSAADAATDIATAHGSFSLVRATDGDPQALSLLLQRQMGELEGVVVASAAAEVGGLVVADGPLRAGLDTPARRGVDIVGYVKTHRTAYGPPEVRRTVAALGVGQRTPLLLVGTPRGTRATWYLRLPCEVAHGWSGVVRVETPGDRAVADLAALADRVTASLPAYASGPTKDARAPQNLYPIGGLERELRRRLGDAEIVHRALRRAARPAPTMMP